MELAIYTTTGTQTEKKAVLSAEVFGIEPNAHAIYLAVKQYLADQRQGTHKAKQRNEVAGSTRKLKRQKGTGLCRYSGIGARCDIVAGSFCADRAGNEFAGGGGSADDHRLLHQ